VAFVGPVSSFHQHITMGFERLTDDEWKRIYASRPPDRPDWTYAYLADGRGEARRGPFLEAEPEVDAPWAWFVPDATVWPEDSTGTPPDDPSPDSGLESETFLAITPNPVREDAIISLRIEGGEPVPARVVIHDSRGRLVRELHEGALPPQLVHIQWDGTESSGRRVGAGVYFLRFEIDSEVTTRKIIVVH
jgi:hypothetical protein